MPKVHGRVAVVEKIERRKLMTTALNNVECGICGCRSPQVGEWQCPSCGYAPSCGDCKVERTQQWIASGHTPAQPEALLGLTSAADFHQRKLANA